MDDLAALELWAAPLLQRLQPSERRALSRKIGVELRRSQQQRIASQQNPDGSAYEPRKRGERIRDRRGRIKERKARMFQRIARASHLKVQSTGTEAAVGFAGRVARIARVHQEGLEDRANASGSLVRYARRQLLGFTAQDRELVQDLLLQHLAGA